MTSICLDKRCSQWFALLIALIAYSPVAAAETDDDCQWVQDELQVQLERKFKSSDKKGLSDRRKNMNQLAGETSRSCAQTLKELLSRKRSDSTLSELFYRKLATPTRNELLKTLDRKINSPPFLDAFRQAARKNGGAQDQGAEAVSESLDTGERSGKNTEGKTSECDMRTPKVNISNGNRPGPFKKNYQACSRKIVNAVNGSFAGLVRIGGPNKRCVDPGPKRSKKEWFEATNGTCKSKNYSGYSKERKYAKFNSTPDAARPGHCSAGGPVFKKTEMFVKTSGTCKNSSGYRSTPSSHAGGFGLDLFVTAKKSVPAPEGCVLDAGDRIASWARTNADAYGIKNVIWNKKIARSSSNWREEDYGKRTKLPHYNHVHIQCEN